MKMTRLLIVLFLLWFRPDATSQVTGSPGIPAANRPVASATVVASNQSPTGGIQEAIDSLGSAGGVVTIPEGEYLLRRSIVVRSHITLQGAGEKTVLRKVKQAGSKLTALADKESRSVELVSTAGFQPGDQIGIFDRETVGWLHSRAIVKSIDGNQLLLDRRVARTFDPAKDAAVVNYFSAITGTQVAGVVLKDLTIDGRPEENPGVHTVARRGLELGFNFAAVNLVDVTDSRIENCRIHGWPSDGISLQRGSGNLVTHCTVERCRGEGYHPGGGLHDSVFSDNLARRNIANGLFFCARVERVTVKNNRFLENGRSGVGDLGRSGDTQNVVEANLCEGNGLCGIELLDGESNTVRNNTCISNSRSFPGKYSGIRLSATVKSVVSGNRCFDNRPTKMQKHGIEELGDCQGNAITDNDCRDNVQSGLALAGRETRQQGNKE